MKRKFNRFSSNILPWNDVCDMILRMLRTGEIESWVTAHNVTFTYNGRKWVKT